jgi:hypothetical protein
MLRASFIGFLVKIGLDIGFVLLGGLGSAFVVGLLPGLMGGLVAGVSRVMTSGLKLRETSWRAILETAGVRGTFPLPHTG